jgi:hypothetical protein
MFIDGDPQLWTQTLFGGNLSQDIEARWFRYHGVLY